MKPSELSALVQVRSLAGSGIARSVRESKRVSLTETAAAAGVAKSTLSRWERGERQPHGAGALRYLTVLHELMGGTDERVG